MENNEGSSAPEAVVSEESQLNQSDNSQELDGAEDQQVVEAAPVVKEIARLKKLKLKIDGHEYEEELPFEIEDKPEYKEWMTRQLQRSKAFDKRASEYNQLESEVKEFVEGLRKNPRKYLSDPSVGVDIKKLAAEIIEEEISNSQKSPEQLEKEKLENELKAMKDEREKEKEEFRKKEFERLEQQAFERYDTLMTKALESTDLPKSPYIVKKMADYMLMGLQQGVDVTPEDVIPLVRDEMMNDLKEMFAVMPEDVIENLVGKDVLNRIRKKKVAAARQAPPTPLNKAVPDAGGKKLEPQEASKKKSIREMWGV